MRALSEWSFDDLVDAHAVLDALEAAEVQAHEDARREAEESRKR
jgi:hypothetical protein